MLALANGPNPHYPKIVGLETLVRCNAARTFWPYPPLQRKGQRMADALIERFINGLAGMPRDLPNAVNPSLINETLLYKRLLPMLEEIARREASAKLCLRVSTSPDALNDHCSHDRYASLMNSRRTTACVRRKTRSCEGVFPSEPIP